MLSKAPLLVKTAARKFE